MFVYFYFRVYRYNIYKYCYKYGWVIVIEHMFSAREHANLVNGRPAIKGEFYLYRYLKGEGLALDNLPRLVGYRLMVRACKMGAIEWVKLLMGKVPLDYQDETGDTPLLLACFWLNFPKENQSITESDFRTKFEIVSLLIENGAEINGAYEYSSQRLSCDSPLVMAANGNCYNIVKLLLRAGVDVPEKEHFATFHRFQLVDPRVSMLIDRVYAAITEVTIEKASLVMKKLHLSHSIIPEILEDILAHHDIRSSSLSVNLEEIIRDVELDCAETLKNVPYRG